MTALREKAKLCLAFPPTLHRVVLTGLLTSTWALSVQASPDREPTPPTTAYVTNQGSETVSVVELATFKVVLEIKVPGHPAGIARSPSRDRIYVTAPDAHDVAVIDTASNAVVKRIPVGGGPLGIAVHPFRGFIYVADWYSTQLKVLDPTSFEVVANIEVGQSPSGIAVSANGAWVVTADRDSDAVSIIDAATNKRVGQIKVGTRPFGVTFAMGSNTIIYSANVGSDDVSVIDLAQMKVIATVPVGRRPYAVAATMEYAFVTNQYSGSISVFHVGNNTPFKTLEACDHPEGINYDWQGLPSGTIYVACWFDNELVRIDEPTMTITGRVKVGDGPRAFGMFLQ